MCNGAVEALGMLGKMQNAVSRSTKPGDSDDQSPVFETVTKLFPYRPLQSL